MGKKVIILWHNGGRLANQLWLYMSVLTYCLEKGYGLENHTYFEYSEYFEIPQNNFWVKLLFFLPFSALNRLFPKKQGIVRKYFFKYYKLHVKWVEFLQKSKVVFAPDGEVSVPHYLPPSPNPDSQVEAFERSKQAKLYLDGWLFRNPVGIEKYRSQIKTFFQPRAKILDRLDKRVEGLRLKYKKIIGVHVRQGDYKYLWDGTRFFNEKEILLILQEYMNNFGLKNDDTCFIFASDGKIDLSNFAGLNVELTGFTDAVEDLFFLSKTDLVIGSDSTFGAFASYYGNIPFIVFKKGQLDWEYYKTKNNYFSNKYSQTVCY